MEITIKELKRVIEHIDDDVLLADLTYGNENFKPFVSIKRFLLLEEESTGHKFLTINGLGSHFTGNGNQKGLKFIKEIHI